MTERNLMDRAPPGEQARRIRLEILECLGECGLDDLLERICFQQPVKHAFVQDAGEFKNTIHPAPVKRAKFAGKRKLIIPTLKSPQESGIAVSLRKRLEQKRSQKSRINGMD